MIREILKEMSKDSLGYREAIVLTSLWKVEKINDFAPYTAYRLYGKGNYIEIVKRDKWEVVG